MKISYNILKGFIHELPEPDELSVILTDTGLEVESVETVESVRGGLKGLVVGHVLKKWKHPNADKLNVTLVNVGGTEPLQIVCGAANVAEDQKVLVALPGTTIYPVGKEEGLILKQMNIRGEISNGMICAEDELGLGQSHDGIMVLDNHWLPGTQADEVFSVGSDVMLEIGLTPNRTDAISHFGVARDVLASLKASGRIAASARLVMPNLFNFKSGQLPSPEIVVRNSDKCSRYAGVLIENVKVGESPMWLQNVLKVIGLRPINNIVDITNYVMHFLGQPLHAFDADVIGEPVIVRTAVEGETLMTLDGVERKLDSEDLLICSTSKSACLAGVFGGADSGVSEKTTRIFLESAVFNPVSVRKTGRRHGLNTDASYRFERGVDVNQVLPALKMAANMMKELAGASIASEIADFYPDEELQHEITFSISKLNEFIGYELGKERILFLLQVLDFELLQDAGDTLQVLVPTYRKDVKGMHDVAEELLRIHGYNNVPMSGRLTYSMPEGSRDKSEVVRERVADMLCARGFHEAMNNSLTKDWEHDNKEVVRLLNPLSNELTVMRTSLIPGLLSNVLWNRNRKQDFVRLFEFGKQYHLINNAFEERDIIAVCIAGLRMTENWRNGKEDASFFDVKDAVNNILRLAGIKFSAEATENQYIDEGQVITSANGKILGFIGVVSKAWLKRADLDGVVFAAELDWGLIRKEALSQQIKYNEIPKFPSVRRDLSLLVEKNTQFGQLEQVVKKQAGALLRNVNLFDVYEGKNLPEGKKSYAISMELRDDETTLTDERVEEVMSNVIHSLASELSAILRQ